MTLGIWSWRRVEFTCVSKAPRTFRGQLDIAARRVSYRSATVAADAILPRGLDPRAL